MLSLGIDAALALAIASASGALPTGSPPPSRAATVTARASLVNCWPRRESTIAFLCLMLAHLECPDMVEKDTWARARARPRSDWRRVGIEGGPRARSASGHPFEGARL